MKLRNKKTGEIYSMWHICIGGEEITSVKQFNDMFEDYTPPEPLIQDDKIRKAVKAWADANDIDNGDDHSVMVVTSGGLLGLYFSAATIWFYCKDNNIKESYYTIAELCGEKE